MLCRNPSEIVLDFARSDSSGVGGSMKALFHSDLLNFGTIILIIMIVGGVVVVVTMCVQSALSIRRRRADQQEEQTASNGPKPKNPEDEHLPKSA